MKTDELVFMGIKGSVVALARDTGEIVWELSLKSGGLGNNGFVHLVLDGENLYAITQGEIFCLDPANGEGRWHNKMKGYGLGLASLVTRNSPSSNLDLVAQTQAQEQANQAAASAGGA